MKKIILVLFIVLLAFPVFAQRQALPRLGIPSPMNNGMGGHHVAFTDNVFSLLVNPGAMVQTRQRSFLNLSIGLYSPGLMLDMFGPVMELIGDAAGDGEIDIQALLEPLAEQGGQFAVGFNIPSIPLISFASVRNGFGLGFWQTGHFNINLNGINSDALLMVDALFPIGFGFTILDFDSHLLDFGFSIIPFGRTWASFGPASVADIIDDVDKFISDMNVNIGYGMTFSAGLMYRWNGLRVGASFNDIYTYMEAFQLDFESGEMTDSMVPYDIPFTLDLGAAYEMNLLGLMDLAFMFSWNNVFNIFDQDKYLTNRNAWLDLSLGAQLRLLGFLNFRVGLSEMLPAVGFGLDLGALKIDFSYYGRELGIEPGDFPAAMAELMISIRTQPSPTNRFWNRRSIVGRLGGPENY